MRKTCREIQVNLAYRWFLGISMDERVPNYSTWSQNYIRRYGDSEVFEEIFDQILKQVNLAYRWFLGISMDERVPNYSTWSQNYIRRYGDSEVFEEIFDQILKQAISYGFVDMETVYGDSTHQKANANKNKYTDEEVEIMKKIYENDLLDEINRDREEHGKKPIKKNEKEELNFDEETGKLKRDIQTKHMKKLKL